MCGLFGGYSTSAMSGDLIKVVEKLGFVSSLRGIDSTGLIAIKEVKAKKKKKKFLPPFRTASRKEVINPISFFQNPATRSMIQGNDVAALIGHCRWATIGNVNYDNSHPIQVGPIIGVHNGTINTFKKEATDNNTTDSAIFYRHIAEDGVDAAINKVGYTGAYAIVFYDERDNTITFARNKERTLYFMYSKCKRHLVWASEYSMLTLVNNHTMISFEPPKLLDTDQVLTLDLEESKWRTRPVKKPAYTGYLPDFKKKEEELKVHVPPLKVVGPHKQIVCAHDHKDCGTKETAGELLARKKEELRRKREEANKKVKEGDESLNIFYYKGWEESFISMPEAKRRLNTGCTYCGHKSGPFDQAFWHGQDHYLCEEHFDDPNVMEFFGSNKKFVPSECY